MSTRPENRRAHARREVTWDGECRVGARFAEGIVRDIGCGGVFFAPTGVHGNIDDRHNEGTLSFVRPGDTVLLKYSPRPDDEPVTVLAQVRWIGRSDAHQASGAGLAFDKVG